MRAFTIKSSTARRLTRILPLPGSSLRRLLDCWDKFVIYPGAPEIVAAHGQRGKFEIRNCREYVQRNIYFLGYYEIRETRLVARFLRPGDVFVDVGANIGWYTVVAARLVGSTGAVYAFEPSQRIQSHLLRNVQLNSLTNVTTERIALADHDGRATLTGASAANEGTGSIIWSINQPSHAGEEVRVMKLDDYAFGKNIERIRLLKIDVEGAEMMVLRGAQRVLRERRCQYILIEVNDRHLRRIGSSASEVFAFLQQCGYRLYRIGLSRLKPLLSHDAVIEANIFAEATD